MKTKVLSERQLIGKMLKESVKIKTELKDITLEMAKPKKEVYTKKEIAEIFNVSERTIDRWRGLGLKCLQSGRNGKVLFKIDDVNNFLKM